MLHIPVVGVRANCLPHEAADNHAEDMIYLLVPTHPRESDQPCRIHATPRVLDFKKPISANYKNVGKAVSSFKKESPQKMLAKTFFSTSQAASPLNVFHDMYDLTG